MTEKNKVEDLGLKIGTKEEAVWSAILEREESALVQNKVNQELQEIIIERAKVRIEEEKEKFK